MQGADLVHHALVDVQTPGGIDDEHVLVVPAGPVVGGAGYGHRVLVLGAGEELGPDLRGQGAQLLDGRRAIDVAAHHHDLLLLALRQPAGQLGDAGGLARALKPRHQDHRRGLGGQVQGLVGLAHDPHQLVVDDLDQHLTRGQGLGDLLPQGLLADVLDELAHHRQGDVGLQQGHAHLAQGLLDVVLGQAALTAQVVQYLGEAALQVLEHALPR